MELDDNPRMQKLFAYFESVQGLTFVENHCGEILSDGMYIPWELGIPIRHNKILHSC